MAQATTVPTSEVTARTTKNSRKDRLLLQIKSLDEADDELTSICKRVSWILRRGAPKVGVRQDQRTRWVKFSDMCACEILNEFSEQKIWQVIVDFNGKKLRYQISEDPGGPWLRAYKRESKEDEKQESKKANQAVAVPSISAPQEPQQAPSQQVQDPQQASQAAAFAAAQPQQMMWNYWPMMTPWMNPYMWQAAAGANTGKCVGRIKSINFEKGFGFIECSYTYALYHRDVFLHKAQLDDLQENSWVQFSFELNQQNMPQAREVQALSMPYMQPPAPPADGGKVGKGGKDSKGKGGKGRGKGGGKKGKNDVGTKSEQGEKSDKGEKDNTKDASEAGAEGAAESAGQASSPAEEGATKEAVS